MPPLNYRQIIDTAMKILNPLGIKFGGDLKTTVKLRDGNIDVITALALRMGILKLMAGFVLGMKLSIGKDGIGFSYGGTLGYGSVNGPDGALANGDTNVPPQNITIS